MKTEETALQGTSALEELDDAIHALAQPLTALLFAIEMAYLHSLNEPVREGLATARTEARRAADVLEQIRAAAGRVREDVMACSRQ